MIDLLERSLVFGHLIRLLMIPSILTLIWCVALRYHVVPVPLIALILFLRVHCLLGAKQVKGLIVLFRRPSTELGGTLSMKPLLNDFLKKGLIFYAIAHHHTSIEGFVCGVRVEGSKGFLQVRKVLINPQELLELVTFLDQRD